jgi:hypothetical protein
VTELHDFHRAQVDLFSIDIEKPGPGGRPAGFSGSILRIDPEGPRWADSHLRLRHRDSVLPDAGGASGPLVHFPPVEFDVGELRD